MSWIGVDLRSGRVRPAGAERSHPPLLLGEHPARLLAHSRRRGISVADDPFAVAAGPFRSFPAAGGDEAQRRRRRGRHRVRERVKARAGRRRHLRAHVGPRHRIHFVLEQSPALERGDVDAVERLEAVLRERSGERSSQAQNAVGGRPRAFRYASIARNPSSIGTGRRKRARSISKPGSAATPPEYWNGPLMKRNPPAGKAMTSAMCAPARGMRDRPIVALLSRPPIVATAIQGPRRKRHRARRIDRHPRAFARPEAEPGLGAADDRREPTWRRRLDRCGARREGASRRLYASDGPHRPRG